MPTRQGFVRTVDLPDGDEVIQHENPKEDCADSRELVATLQGQLEILVGELAVMNEQIREIHVLLQQSQAALPVPRPWLRGRGVG